MPQRPDVDHPRGRTVLLAEDDDAFRATLALWLEDAGQWAVREATNGREALDRVDSTVDVLVLDRLMPGLTGPEVVENLGETSFAGAVVVLSAYEADTLLDGDHEYVTAYLTKPIEKVPFLAMLEQTLR